MTDRTSAIQAARQEILDKIKLVDREIFSAQERLAMIHCELRGFDAAIAVMEPETFGVAVNEAMHR